MLVLLYLFGLAIGIWVISLVWRILDKAGYSGALSLLLLIPFVNGLVFLILLCVLAYGQWPRFQPHPLIAVPVVPVYQQPGYPQQPVYPQMGNLIPDYQPYQQPLPDPQYSQYPQQQTYPSYPPQY